jgi:DNA modification methylase
MKIDNLKLNTIYNLDCVEGLKRIPNKSVELLLTDPPYGISRSLNCEGQKLGSTAKLNFNFGKWDKVNNDWVKEALEKTNGWAIIFCAKRDIDMYWNLLEKEKFIAIDVIVWQKPDPIPLNGKTKFLNAWESAIIGKRNGSYWGGYCTHNILKYQAPKGKERIHPTQKPLKLIQELIKLTTKEGNTVLDPFMGSGTTAVAAKSLKRKFIGFEIDKKYFKLAEDRLNNTISNKTLFD